MNRPIRTARRFPRAGIVFIIIVAACLLGALTGCGENPKENHRLLQLTDDEGCKYVGIVGDKNAPAIVNSRLDPIIGRDGKQVCLLGAKAGGVL